MARQVFGAPKKRKRFLERRSINRLAFFVFALWVTLFVFCESGDISKVETWHRSFLHSLATSYLVISEVILCFYAVDVLGINAFTDSEFLQETDRNAKN